MSKQVLKSIRWSIAYLILIPVIVCALVVWTAYVRTSDFKTSQYKIAQTSVSSVASEITRLINNQQRLLKSFVNRELAFIQKLANDPENEDLKEEIEGKLNELFPEYFAFTVADHQGEPFLYDFEGFVGEFCQSDIKSHASGKPHLLRIHPNHHNYHVDFMVPWGKKKSNSASAIKDGGIFFVSFSPDFISRLLKVSSPARHELRLINTSINGLIEIVESGSRIVIDRDDFRLTEDEKNRILYSLRVKNTYWQLTDFIDETLLSEYRNEVIKFSIVILTLFIVGSILMTVLLLRAEKGRIRSEQVKDEMFALFNHDLRSPLTVMDSFMQLILMDPEYTDTKDKEFKRCVLSAYDNVGIMRRIVDDILDLKKMESGKMSFEFIELELISLVRRTLELNQQLANKDDIKLEIETDLTDVYIKGDPERLIQALTNLLSNAIKYSPKHEVVKVKVELENRNVAIVVSDKGPGIEKEFQPLLFNKFSQSKSKLTRSVSGTGLGLAIVKHIVVEHNGVVTFETELDKGTSFKIMLKLLIKK